MSKASDAEKAQAIARLREWIKPGDTLYTVLRNVSRSGMSRRIDLYAFGKNDRTDECEPMYLTGSAARAIGYRMSNAPGEGAILGGCGMDMGFEFVYQLGSVMFPDGVPCAGEKRCHSNDHSNSGPQRDQYGDAITHRDGGYAFRHRWMG